MDQEPHHHVALRNNYVKVFKLEVSPGDSIVLHRHDQDTVAIAIGDQDVTVGMDLSSIARISHRREGAELFPRRAT
jgi:hypothetical protein